MTGEERARMDAQLERVVQEEREWATARLHHKLHGTWLSPDECARCIEEAEDDAA